MERIHDAHTWIDAALRRQGEYVGALFAVAETDPANQSAALGALIVAASDLLNSSMHAITATERLGPLAIASDPMVKLLRNVHEHWDETRQTFVAGGPPKVRSGKTLGELTDVSPWRFAYSNVPGVGVSLGPLPMASLQSVLAECVSVTGKSDALSTWQPTVMETREPPVGLLALNVLGQIVRNPTLGLTLFQPVMTVWDPDLHV